jgi:hypothetical protein
MPDLVTHTTIAYLLSNNARFTRYRAFFYLGTILPDIITRPIYIIKPELYGYTTGMHTPVYVFVLILLFAELFRKEYSRFVRLYMVSGALLHFFLDALQRHLVGGYYWFFPFSFKTYNWGLFWPDSAVQLFPFWIATIAIVEFIIRTKRLP